MYTWSAGIVTVKFQMLALVRKLEVFSPGMLGTLARPPVATHALANFSVCPFTSTVFLLVNTPLPTNTSTPSSVNRLHESFFAMSARSLRLVVIHMRVIDCRAPSGHGAALQSRTCAP